MSTLELRNACKSFGDVDVIKDVELSVGDGEFTVFVGPSGSGKSTLLRMVAGLETLTAGGLFIDGKDVTGMPPIERGVAMVFQSYALYPHMSVAENIGFGLKVAGVPKAEIKNKVEEAASVLKLEPLLQRKPKALSGGQRQRVAIGRAIVKQPKIFLFDEPLSNLDAELRVQMRLEIARLHEELGATMIYVTHDQVEAMTLADKIVVLRDGQIEQVGSPVDLYLDPDNEFVAGFIGSPRMNFVECEVTSVLDGQASVQMPGDGTDVLHAKLRDSDAMPGKAKLGFRPEHIELCDGGPMRGKIVSVEKLGSTSFLYVETPQNEEITIEHRGLTPHQPGEVVQFEVNPEYLHLFEESGKRM